MNLLKEMSSNHILMETQEYLGSYYLLEKLENQTRKGLEKYPNTVRSSDYSVLGWIDHCVEEKIDCLVYYHCLKERLQMDGEMTFEREFMIDKEIESINISLQYLDGLRNDYMRDK